ncbi:MAG: hypothetical protein QM644_05900 [Mobilitalea sp.]
MAVDIDIVVDIVVDLAAGIAVGIADPAAHLADHFAGTDNNPGIAVLLNNLVVDTVAIDLIGFDLDFSPCLDFFRFD